MPPRWPLSVEAYEALGQMGLIPRNAELLRGEIYLKTPKSPLHSRYLLRLLRLLLSLLKPGFLVRPEQPIACPDSEPEPDLSVVKGSEDDYAEAHPKTAELVIEVCITSHEYERSKLRAYASAGVTEVWLVLVPERVVEVYRHPSDAAFAERTVVGPKECLEAISAGLIRLPLDKVFAD